MIMIVVIWNNIFTTVVVVVRARIKLFPRWLFTLFLKVMMMIIC